MFGDAPDIGEDCEVSYLGDEHPGGVVASLEKSGAVHFVVWSDEGRA